MIDDMICDDPTCINNPDNYNEPFDPDNNNLCEKCFIIEVEKMSVDDLMEVHVMLTNFIDSATTIEAILALPFATDDIIDELMAYQNIEEIADAIKDKWTNRFNILLQHKIAKG